MSFADNKQLLDEVFVMISRIIKVKPSASADNPCRDLNYSGYHKVMFLRKATQSERT